MVLHSNITPSKDYGDHTPLWKKGYPSTTTLVTPLLQATSKPLRMPQIKFYGECRTITYMVNRFKRAPTLREFVRMTNKRELTSMRIMLNWSYSS